jgi:hypothetical protein
MQSSSHQGAGYCGTGSSARSEASRQVSCKRRRPTESVIADVGPPSGLRRHPGSSLEAKGAFGAGEGQLGAAPRPSSVSSSRSFPVLSVGVVGHRDRPSSSSSKEMHPARHPSPKVAIWARTCRSRTEKGGRKPPLGNCAILPHRAFFERTSRTRNRTREIRCVESQRAEVHLVEDPVVDSGLRDEAPHDIQPLFSGALRCGCRQFDSRFPGCYRLGSGSRDAYWTTRPHQVTIGQMGVQG